MNDREVKVGHLVADKYGTYIVLEQNGPGWMKCYLVMEVDMNKNGGTPKKKEKAKTLIMSSAQFELQPIIIDGLEFDCRLKESQLSELTDKDEPVNAVVGC